MAAVLGGALGLGLASGPVVPAHLGQYPQTAPLWQNRGRGGGNLGGRAGHHAPPDRGIGGVRSEQGHQILPLRTFGAAGQLVITLGTYGLLGSLARCGGIRWPATTTV